MIKKYYILYMLTLFCLAVFAQDKIDVNAVLDIETKTISISQTIVYKNNSNTTWQNIYLNDWNNSYSNKSTPLAKRFEDEFSTKFHLAKDEQRGFTKINLIKEGANKLEFSYLKAHPDILKVNLKTPLKPGDSYTITLKYLLKIPNATFTGYGVTDTKDFQLKYWYITPTHYDGKWNYYSNKNLDDLFVPKANVTITIAYPSNYKIISELDQMESVFLNGKKMLQTKLYGTNRVDTYLSLKKSANYSVIQTDDFTVISNIPKKELSDVGRVLITDKITQFLTKNFGKYPHNQLLVTSADYNKNPLYGLNQLPDFFRPFPDDFQYELKLLKTAIKKYLDNTLLMNPRKEHWLSEGIQIYFLMKYVDTYYPDMKLLGSLAKVWGVRAFHASDLDFNYQYFLYAMEIARKNKDQALTTSKDLLTKFNANIAGKYKAGMGLNYLDKFADDINLSELLTEFAQTNQLKTTTTKHFKHFITSKTSKNVDWFFSDYINSRKKIDFKIKSVVTHNDTITVTLKNKTTSKMPISLYKLRNDTVIDKVWVEHIAGTKTIQLAKDGSNKLALDYNTVIPEFNQRDNYKAIDGSFLNNKPLQLRLFKDIEDPHYNQIFLMPLVQFNNIYDGITLGTKIYNKTILRKKLNYKLSPQYATKSKSLTGGLGVFYTHNIENKALFNITYGISTAYQSFAQDSYFTKIRPSVSFLFRDKSNLRSNEINKITARYVSISRAIGNDAIIEVNEPDYGVFNLRYTSSKPGVINYSNFSTDFQLANKFSKLSLSYEFRKLTKQNRNINFRFFTGVFLENNTDLNSNYFSFALDRPTDYLFDLSYLGRSENAGLFSQQIIITEGGFKSQLETPYANQWISTANFSTSIWRYIQAYGDVGLVKNKFSSAKFVYDSGIRLNLVEDYLELYFPVYSNLGWEIAQPNYAERIRFIISVDPQVLLGLFRRKWY